MTASPNPDDEPPRTTRASIRRKHRQELILAATEAELETTGIHGTTLERVGERVGLSRAERKNAELFLRRLTTGKGPTEDEIRQVVQSLADAVKLLAGASPQDRRRGYEADQLKVLYDHENRRAQPSVAPWDTGGVGGGT